MSSWAQRRAALRWPAYMEIKRGLGNLCKKKKKKKPLRLARNQSRGLSSHRGVGKFLVFVSWLVPLLRCWGQGHPAVIKNNLSELSCTVVNDNSTLYLNTHGAASLTDAPSHARTSFPSSQLNQ